jgi:hypothetical protein
MSTHVDKMPFVGWCSDEETGGMNRMNVDDFGPTISIVRSDRGRNSVVFVSSSSLANRPTRRGHYYGRLDPSRRSQA